MDISNKPSENEKALIAKMLDQSGIEVIEIAHINNSSDLEAIARISKEIKNAEICVLSDCEISNIKKAISFLQNVKKSRLNIYSNANASSDGTEKIVSKLQKSISFAANKVDKIQWTAFDGNRARFDILKKQIEATIIWGTDVICIPDTMGVSTTVDFQQLIKNVQSLIKKTDNIELSVHCHNNSDLAYANSRMASMLGVAQVEATMLAVRAEKGNCNTVQFAEYLNAEENGKYDIRKIREAAKIIN